MAGMLTVKDLKVVSLDQDYLDLYWAIDNTFEDVNSFTFTIERSEAAMGPWDQASQPFEDKYHYRDVNVNLIHRFRQYWYRIKITRKEDDEVTYSASIRMQPRPDKVAMEVRRLERMLFKEFVGRRCYLFPARTFGQRCPSCFDRVSGQSLRSHCLTCYDTTFAKGFLDPIEIWMQIDPCAQGTQLLQITETQQQNTSARLGDFPPTKPRDIIVEAGENRRWRVERVTETQRLRAVLHQELVLHEIPLSDIEYKLPVRLDELETVNFSPGRNFTNPQQLEAVDDSEYFTKIAGVFRNE